MKPGGGARTTPVLDVVVLGGAAVDWVARVAALPPRDGLALARSCTRFPGGSAANVASGLARLGQRVGFVGKMGDDENGQYLLRAFEREGVDARRVVVEAGQPTATCFVAVDDGGERLIFALPGASIIERVTELDLTYVSAGRALYVGPTCAEVAIAVVAATRESGGTVFYAPGGGWGQGGLEDIRPILSVVDVLLVSHAEAAVLTGRASLPEAVRLLSQEGPPVIVVTLGKQGALVLTDGLAAQCPAFPVADVRDSTGAGDAFAAGLVAGFLEGLDWEASARLGSAVAAFKIQHIGARSGLPTRQEVETFLADSAGSVGCGPTGATSCG